MFTNFQNKYHHRNVYFQNRHERLVPQGDQPVLQVLQSLGVGYEGLLDRSRARSVSASLLVSFLFGVDPW